MTRIDWDEVIEHTALAVLPGPLAARLILWREDRRSDAGATASRRQDRLRSILEPAARPAAEVAGENTGVTRDGTIGLPIRRTRGTSNGLAVEVAAEDTVATRDRTTVLPIRSEVDPEHATAGAAS
jgi:hypothetical protein